MFLEHLTLLSAASPAFRKRVKYRHSFIVMVATALASRFSQTRSHRLFLIYIDGSKLEACSKLPQSVIYALRRRERLVEISITLRRNQHSSGGRHDNKKNKQSSISRGRPCILIGPTFSIIQGFQDGLSEATSVRNAEPCRRH